MSSSIHFIKNIQQRSPILKIVDRTLLSSMGFFHGLPNQNPVNAVLESSLPPPYPNWLRFGLHSLLSFKLKEALKEVAPSEIEFYPMTIRHDTSVVEYYSANFLANGSVIDFERSVLKKFPDGYYSEAEALYFKEEDWVGPDVFVADGDKLPERLHFLSDKALEHLRIARFNDVGFATVILGTQQNVRELKKRCAPLL